MKSQWFYGLLALVCLGIGLWAANRSLPPPLNGGRIPQHPDLALQARAFQTALANHGKVIRHTPRGDIESEVTLLEADDDLMTFSIVQRTPDRESSERVLYHVQYVVLDETQLAPVNDALTNPQLEAGWYCRLKVSSDPRYRGYIESTTVNAPIPGLPRPGTSDQLRLYLDSKEACRTVGYLLKGMIELRRSAIFPDRTP